MHVQGRKVLDTVGGDCENVQATEAGNAMDDRPPSVAWTAPAAAARLVADRPSVLQVDASDDRGVALVRFLDDDRIVCEDAAPPFTCAYQARGDDVGRDTLTAVAVDGAGQTASAQRAVTVSRFKPSLSLTVSYAKSRYTAAGRLARPATVAAGEACDGSVTVTIKRGKRTLTTRRAKLSKNCRYSVAIKRSRAKLSWSARFGGNGVIDRRSSKSVTKR